MSNNPFPDAEALRDSLPDCSPTEILIAKVQQKLKTEMLYQTAHFGMYVGAERVEAVAAVIEWLKQRKFIVEHNPNGNILVKLPPK